MSEYYVYMHIKQSDGTPFYVGKGRGKGAWSHKGRNNYWCNIVKKYGYEVVILKDNLTEKEAFELEIATIATLDRKYLCNLTDGGEGISGLKRSEEHKRKISEAKIGKKASEETRKKMSISRIGNKNMNGKKHSEETKRKIGDYSRGKPGKRHSEETRKKLSEWQIGRKLSEEHKKNVGEAQKIPVETTTGLKFKSAKDAAIWLQENGNYKAAASRITACCKGKQKSAYGYVWVYLTKV